MVLQPQTKEELSRDLAAASRDGRAIAHIKLSALCSLVEHHPEDMTATVEAGMTLGDFQELLRPSGQWLPVDPVEPRNLTLGDLLAYDVSGPRRLGFGTIRDYLIGIRVAMADGEIIKAGGKVVKNVAGFDVGKLFIGGKHTLGIIVEASFKLKPLPEAEAIVVATFDRLTDLHSVSRALLRSPADPVILDAYRAAGGPLQLVAGFAGSSEDVEAQLAVAQKLSEWAQASTEYDSAFQRAHPAFNKTSILPSRTSEFLARLGGAPFVARYGNGVIYHNCHFSDAPALPNQALAERLKKIYDPCGIFPVYKL